VLSLAAYVCVLAVEYYLRLRSVQRHHLESAWMWFVAAMILATLTAKRPAGDDADLPPWSATRSLPLTLVAAAIVLYYPAFRLGFLSDDFVLSALAARREFFGQSWAFFRPL